MRHLYLNTPDGSSCNLKPSQLIRAAIMTPTELNKIAAHMDYLNNQKKDTTMREAYINATKRCSQDIKKTWKNTLLNKQKERLEKREQRLKQQEEYKNSLFRASLEEQQKEREKRLDAVRQYFLLQRDDIKNVNSAYVFTEVLRERQEQLKFNEKLRAKEKKKHEDYENRVKKDVEYFLEQERKRKEDEFHDKLKRRDEIIADIRNRQSQDKEERERELQLEKEDLALMAEEMNLIKENMDREAERKKALMLSDLAESKRNAEERKKFEQLMDEDQEKTQAIYLKFKKRIDCGIKKQMVQEREEELRRQTELQKHLKSLLAGREDDLKWFLDKGIRLADASSAEDEKRRLDNLKRLRQERIDAVNASKVQFKEERELKKTLKEWDAALNFKKTEIQKMRDLKRKEEVWQNKMDVRRAYDDQMCELREKRRLEKEEDLRSVRLQLYENMIVDEAFFKYANEYIQKAREHGSSEYPLRKVVEKYIKRHGLNNTEKHSRRRLADLERWKIPEDQRGAGAVDSPAFSDALTVWKPQPACSVPCSSGQAMGDGACLAPKKDPRKLRLPVIDQCGRKIEE